MPKFSQTSWLRAALHALLAMILLMSTGCIMAAPALHRKQLQAEAREEKMWNLEEQQRQRQEQSAPGQKPLKPSDF